MLPVVEVFGRELGLYTIIATVGALVAGYYVCRNVRKRGDDTNDAIVLMLVAAIGALVFSHVVYGLVNAKLIPSITQVASFDDFLRYLRIVFGGSVFFGGLIGGFISGLIYARNKRLPIAPYFDLISPAVPLFHAFGRVGCFFAGCCYGIECEFGFTVTRSLTEAANGATRLPIQLIEATFNLILFLTLNYLYRRGKLRHRLFPLYLLCYSIARFTFEFFRGDSLRGYVGVVSTSQLIAVFIFIGSIAWLIYAGKNKG